MSVAPILLTVAEMGLMKGEGEDLVERLSGVSPPVPAEAEAEPAAAAAAATEAVCSAELKVDVETAVPLLASPALPPAPVTPPSLPTLRLLLAFGVDDLGMKDEANGDPPPLFAVAAGILVISTRSIDGEKDRDWSSPAVAFFRLLRSMVRPAGIEGGVDSLEELEIFPAKEA